MTNPDPTAPNRGAMLDFDSALRTLLAQASCVAREECIDTMHADGRVLAADVVSCVDVPAADNSAMDGYAVRLADLQADPKRAWPVSQRIPAGHAPGPLQTGTVARIFTGAPVPAGADAVVLQECADVNGDGNVRFSEVPEHGASIRRRGEDIMAGSVVLQAGTRLKPQHCGVIASIGQAQVSVRAPLKVACFFTGNELAMPGEPLQPGQVYNSNRYLLTSLLARLGCTVTDLGRVPDSLDATRAALREASDADLVVTCAGVSVGDEDYVRPAVQAEGSLDMWRIAMKPGKPLAYGRIRREPAPDAQRDAGQRSDARGGDARSGDAGHPHGQARFAHFIGLPGNPVSAFVTFLMLVRPFLLRLQGVQAVAPTILSARADFEWPKPDKRREFLRVRVDPESGHLQCFAHHGSGVLTSATWADGLVDLPAGATIGRGDVVRYLPLSALIDG